MTRPLVIYHGNCADGFCAAWVAAHALLRRFDEPAELFAGKYGEEPPYELAKDRCVYIVDFSYPRAPLEKLWADCNELVVLDHHKTAQADLEGLAYAVFDMDRSGAGMTWDYFHPNVLRPWIVDYVEDRDLWRFKLPWSELVSLDVRLTPQTLEAYDALASMPVEQVAQRAEGAKRYLDHYVQDALRNAYLLANVYEDATAVVLNMTYTGVSDVLNAALEQFPQAQMAIGWLRDKNGLVQCSCRSRRDYDCSAFAKSLGGGGHAQAAGFRFKPTADLALRLFGLAP